MTIPLQITLSDFRLSGFVILVFSKQKGITVVFRNDPLESLKVSSTFDSIPFVRDFLQREIEAQLRNLFMDELPAIIHRLSLRLWVPEYQTGDELSAQANSAATEGPGQDPLSSPPQDPVDSLGNALDESEIASLSLDSSAETHSLFSQKNLLRLAALTDSQRTLSLFTPSIREVVYRAWTSPADLGDVSTSVTSPALSRTNSQIGSLSSIADSASTISMHTRLSTHSHSYSGYGLSMGAGRHSKAHARKRKKRVVDLRRPKTTDDALSVSEGSVYTDTNSAPSVCSAPLPILEEQTDDPVTPPLLPQSGSHLPAVPERHRLSTSQSTPRRGDHHSKLTLESGESSTAFEAMRLQPANEEVDATPRARRTSTAKHDRVEAGPSSFVAPRPLPASALSFNLGQTNSGVLDQVLVEKLAGEIARRMREDKLMASSSSCSAQWERQEETPPPAYGQ